MAAVTTIRVWLNTSSCVGLQYNGSLHAACSCRTAQDGIPGCQDENASAASLLYADEIVSRVQLHSIIMWRVRLAQWQADCGGGRYLMVCSAVADGCFNVSKFELVPWQNRVSVSSGLQNSESTCPPQHGLQGKAYCFEGHKVLITFLYF